MIKNYPYKFLYWALDGSKRKKRCDWMSNELLLKKLGPHCYQVERTWFCQSGIVGSAAQLKVGGLVVAALLQNGMLFAFPGFVFDGPSGPTIDTPDALIGALPHDILYRMAREGRLAPGLRDDADRLAKKVWVQAGMYDWRAHLWLKALRAAGGPSYHGVDPTMVIK